MPAESIVVDGPELEQLLGEPDVSSLLGSRVRSARSLSRFRAATAPRTAWCVDLLDGRRVKVRRLKPGDMGQRLADLLATTDPNDFARILASRGRLVVEEWINGTPVDTVRLDDGVFRLAGALLGRLHAVSPTPSTSTIDDRTAMDADVERLCEAQMLDRSECSRLRAMIEHHDPATTTRGIVHGDFCGENLVLGKDRRLCAIDNEDMAAGSVDGDLIRSLERWSLVPDQQAAFLSGYLDFRDPAAAFNASLFWVVRSRAHSARVRSAAGDWKVARAHVRTLTSLAGAPPFNRE